MRPAPLAANEGERLEALVSAHILDTDPEPFFEDVVDAVVDVVRTPVALVTFVDDRRQWFKARRGLSAVETPREQAFCAYTILNDAPLIVSDARADARFFNNPLVSGDPHAIAYLGAPIILSCGSRLGSACAIDHKARRWSLSEITFVERAARLVARHIEARRASVEQTRQKFLEAALKHVETRYESVLQSMSEGMVVHGPSGAIIDSNHAAHDILGLSKDELFGLASRDRRWRAVRADGREFPGEDHPAMVTLRTGRPQTNVVMGIETGDGQRRWISINSYPVRASGSERVDQAIAVFRVLTNGPS